MRRRRACSRAAADAGTDRRKQPAALSRPRRFRLHQPVEFSAGDFPRPGERGARRRQCRGCQARRADAACRRARGCAAASRPASQRPRCILCPATAPSARASSPIRASPVSSSPARPKSAAPSTGRSPQSRPDRAADRRDRRHQRHDRRRHRAARTGDRRRGGVRFPLRRPALLGAAASVPAGRRGGRRCSTCSSGAARELKVGDPREPATHVGPVIDAEAKDKLESWIAEWAAPAACASAGTATGRCPPAEPMWRRR